MAKRDRESYQEVVSRLYSIVPSFQDKGAEAYKPGLERILELDQRLGAPNKRLKTIHVGGTNGKGSTSHMLACVLQKQGYKVGLHTSPHLKDFRERIKIDGEMISQEAVVDFFYDNLALIKELELSFFEVTFGMALDWFARNEVDYAVIEVGLGGRLDATNIVDPLVSIITNISIEHTFFLGDTAEKIAIEKGGIIKPNGTVVIGEKESETSPIFEQIARKNSAEILFAEEMFSYLSRDENEGFVVKKQSTGEEISYTLDLLGDYQIQNLITVLSTIESLRKQGVVISDSSIVEGLRVAGSSTGLMGRWQKLCDAPLTICDTGHNPSAMKILGRQIERQKYDRLYIVFGAAEDKEIEKMLRLLPSDATYIFTRANSERSASLGQLQQIAQRLELTYHLTDSVPQGYALAKELAILSDMIFIGGSSFVVAEVV